MISRATTNFHIMTENHFYLILLLIRGGASEGERISKKLHKLFGSEQLKITTEFGKSGTDYLNLYLDLKNDCYRQWNKPNSEPIYVNKLSK